MTKLRRHGFVEVAEAGSTTLAEVLITPGGQPPTQARPGIESGLLGGAFTAESRRRFRRCR